MGKSKVSIHRLEKSSPMRRDHGFKWVVATSDLQVYYAETLQDAINGWWVIRKMLKTQIFKQYE